MDIILIFIGFTFLAVGGHYIVQSAVSLSFKLNISKFVIGMTVVSFATSLPELIVSINAAVNGSPSIALNNVIGSNIANIGLVLAFIAILGNISVEKNFYSRDWPWMFFISVIAALLIYTDNNLTSIEGLVFLFLLLLFIYSVLKKRNLNEISEEVDEKLILVSYNKIFIWLIISSLALYYGSEFLIEGAVNLAKQFNISEAVISVTIIAVGTSIPELAASVVALAKGEKGVSVGNLIGSNIFNIGSVLGITAVIKNIPVAQEIIQRDIIWMLVFALLILLLSILPKKDKLSKYKGLTILVLYFIFIFQAFS